MAIKEVILWQNGMLMVFDENGQQVPEYQGPVDKVGEKLAAMFPRERWKRGSWREGWVV